MVDTVVINTANDRAPEPSLEEQAKAAGIDVENVDPSSTSQSAEGKVSDEGMILGKFKSVDDLVKSYQELEKKVGQPKEETPATEAKSEGAEEEGEAKSDKPDSDTEKTVEEQAEEAVEKAGLNLEELSDKYWEKGGLEESDYEALAEAGYPKNVVDQFIAGQQAIVENETLKVHNSVGGSEAYQEMIDWAKDNLSSSEISAYDRAVNSDNMDDVLNAVKGLKARMTGEVGSEPSRRVTGTTKAGPVERFNSIAELTAAIGDPRYAKDPAYRASVEQKLARSDIL